MSKGAEGVSGLIHDGINAYVSATKKRQSVARGCRAALLGNDVGVKCVQGCRRYLLAYSRRLQGELSSDEKVAKCCPRVPRSTDGERYGALMSPKDIARLSCGTI